MSAGRVPSYQQIVDDLVARIRDGEYGPGARLPTESQMKRGYGVSSTTARAAVRQLAALGLVETRHGLGAFVIDRTPVTLVASGGDDGAGEGGAWLVAVRRAGRVATRRSDCLIVAATTDQAALLAVAPGEPLVVRRAWWLVDGLPAVIESDHYPRRVVDVVPSLAAPVPRSSADPGCEITAALAAAGFTIRWHRDRVSARPPTQQELTFFRTPPGVCLLAVVRVASQQRGELPVRLTETVYRSDLHEIVYETPAS